MLGKRLLVSLFCGILLISISSINITAQWRRVGDKPQEDTRSIVFVEVNPTTYIAIAGMKRFGVFYSNFESGNWSPWQPTGLNEFALYDSSLEGPAQVNTLACLGTRLFAGTSSGKIFWSSDYSVNYTNPWVEATGLPGNPVMDIVVAPNGNVLAAVRGSGIYRSIDNGETFSLLAGTENAGSGYFMALALHANYSTNGQFWSVTEEGVSNNGGIYFWNGNGWTDLTPIGVYSFTSIVVSPESGDPANIWVGDSKGSGLLHSNDLGATWTSYLNFCDPVLTLKIPPNYNPANPSLFIGTKIGLFHLIGSAIQDIYPKGLAISSIEPDPVIAGVFWFSTSSGVRKGFPGVEFPQEVDSGNLALFDISVIEGSPSINSDNTIFALSKKYGLFISKDGGNSFSLYMPPLERSQATNPEFDIIGFAPSPTFSGTLGACNTQESTVFHAIKGKGVFKSTTGGSSYVPINNGISGNLEICTFASTPNLYDYPLFAARCNEPYICRFNNNSLGGGWECSSLPSPIPSQVNVIAFPKNFPTPPIVFVGTNNGLFVSTDGGSTFNFDTALPLPPSNQAEVTAIAFNPLFNGTDEQTAFVVRGGSIFKKVFNGSQWEWLLIGQSSFPQYYVKNIAISPNYQTDGIVAVTFNNPTDHSLDGVYLSNNGGDTFSNITGNLTDRYPITLKFIQTQSGLKLFAGLRKVRLSFSNGPTFDNWQQPSGWETSPPCINTTVMSIANTPTNCTTFSAPSDVFLGTCKGVFWSNDGGETFRPINEGLVYSQSGTGCSPISVKCLHLEDVVIDTIKTPILMAGTDGFGIWYRIPTRVDLSGGLTAWDWSNGNWIQATGDIPNNAVVYNFSKETNLLGNVVRAATNSGVYASSNATGPSGQVWVSMELNEDVRGVCHGKVKNYSSSFPHVPEAPQSGTVWGTTWGSGVKKGTEQNLKSPNPESITWQVRNGQGAGTIEEMNNWCIVQLSSDLSVLVGGDNKGIFRSPDEGLTLWYPSNGGIENTSLRVRELLEVESNGDILCAIEGSGSSYDGGIFISADNGFNWACISTGFTPEEQKLSDVVYSSGNPPVYYAGTYNKGTYAGTITPLDPPTITSLDVTSGPSTGGTTVTITGTNFRCSCPQYYDCTHFGISQAVASFGGIDATTTSCSETQLVVTTPSHLSGTVDVKVRNPDTRSVISPNAFTFTGSSNATVYVSRDSSNNIVITTDPISPTRVFRAINPQFTGYVKVDLLSNGSYTYQDNSGENAYIYYYKVE